MRNADHVQAIKLGQIDPDRDVSISVTSALRVLELSRQSNRTPSHLADTGCQRKWLFSPVDGCVFRQFRNSGGSNGERK
jgi:hypothetical protein